jgi:hypothetical protein
MRPLPSFLVHLVCLGVVLFGLLVVGLALGESLGASAMAWLIAGAALLGLAACVIALLSLLRSVRAARGNPRLWGALAALVYCPLLAGLLLLAVVAANR